MTAWRLRNRAAFERLRAVMESAGIREYECRRGWAYFGCCGSFTASTGEETLAEARAILEAHDAP